MGHGHDHDHGHGHGHGAATRPDQRRRLLIVLLLVLGYMVAEVVGGIASGSLALLADAGHMLSDAAALGLSLFAVVIAGRPASAQRTYGHYRAEILAALANAVALGVIAILVAVEAVQRLGSPPEVRGGLMLTVACGGLVVNLLGLWILSGGKEASLNVRGAWLHVLSDTLGSVGAIASGLAVWQLGWRWADPAASLLISALVIWSAWRLLRETVSVLMMEAPAHLDVEEIRGALAGVSGVTDVHDLHVWTITSGLDSLSGHVVVGFDCHREELLRAIRELLAERFGIEHVTIQIEPLGFEEERTPV